MTTRTVPRVELWLGIASLAVSAASVAVLPATGVGRMAAFALAGAGTAHVAPFIARSLASRSGRKVIGALPVLIPSFVAAVMFWPFICGERPVMGDHTVHFSRIKIFAEELIPSWRLRGWSDHMFAGFPAGYHYHVLVDVITALIPWISLQAVSLDAAYAWVFTVGWLLPPAAVYHVAKREYGRAVAGLASLLVIIDGGAHPFMGWGSAVTMGAWLSGASCGIGLLTVPSVVRLLEGQGNRRDAGALGLISAIAMLSHPMQALNLPLLWLTAFAAARLAGHRPGRRALALVAVAGVLSVLMAAYWWLPALHTRDQMARLGISWRPVEELGRRFAAGRLFYGSSDLVLFCGLAGSVLLLFARRTLPVLFALHPFVILTLCSKDMESALMATGIGPLTDLVTSVEFTRFSAMIKPLMMVNAAWLLLTAFEHVVRALREHRADDTPAEALSHRTVVRSALITAFAGPFLLGVASETAKLQVARPRVDPAVERAREAASTLVDRIESLSRDDTRFFRIGVSSPKRIGEHLLADLPLRLGRPIYKVGWTPANHFEPQPLKFDLSLLKLLSVRYYITHEQHHDPSFRLIEEAGELRLYEIDGWAEQRFTVKGTGAVTIRTHEPERIVFEAGAGAKGTILLHMSYFSRWHATRDGTPVALRSPRFPPGVKNTLRLIELDLRPGVYELRFVRSWPEHVGALCFWLGLAGTVALILPSRTTGRSRMQPHGE